MSIKDLALNLKTISSTRAAVLIGMIALVAGPITIIAFGGGKASNVPAYVWVVASIMLLAVIGTGYYLFTRNRDWKDISIRPNLR